MARQSIGLLLLLCGTFLPRLRLLLFALKTRLRASRLPHCAPARVSKHGICAHRTLHLITLKIRGMKRRQQAERRETKQNIGGLSCIAGIYAIGNGVTRRQAHPSGAARRRQAAKTAPSGDREGRQKAFRHQNRRICAACLAQSFSA